MNRTINLKGYTIQTSANAHTYEITFQSGGSIYFVQIESPVRVKDRGHEAQEIKLDDKRLSLFLADKQAVVANIRDDGVLELVFEDDASLTVPAGDKFESWNLNGPDGLLIVSGIHGEVSVWS